MPRFTIYRSYGYAGTESSEEIEAESLKDAEEEAWQFALENVDSWAVPFEDD